MDAYKVTNEALTGFALSVTKQTIDFNQMVWNEYMKMNRSIIDAVPALDVLMPGMPGSKK